MTGGHKPEALNQIYLMCNMEELGNDKWQAGFYILFARENVACDRFFLLFTERQETLKLLSGHRLPGGLHSGPTLHCVV